jgi:phosphoglycolate phosphatase
MDRLSESGMGMSVLSNKSHEYTVLMCEALLGNWSIRRAQGVEKDALRKPNPTMALEMATELKKDPGDMFFVGDSEIDVDTGRRAGMKTIAVTWGFRSEADLLRSSPDHLVTTPAQVADILLA